ncbi:hypothetical protein M3Y99_00028100 [Aphelenchoides fujianensis]|nr:hypothetical protein M3Y99_00028100 [Aphelenchoides fujianensis]
MEGPHITSTATVRLKTRHLHDERPCTSSASLRLSLEVEQTSSGEPSIASPLSTTSSKSADVRATVESIVNEVAAGAEVSEGRRAADPDGRPTDHFRPSGPTCPLVESGLERRRELEEMIPPPNIFHLDRPRNPPQIPPKPPQISDFKEASIVFPPEEPPVRSESVENLDPKEQKREDDVIQQTNRGREDGGRRGGTRWTSSRPPRCPKSREQTRRRQKGGGARCFRRARLRADGRDARAGTSAVAHRRPGRHAFRLASTDSADSADGPAHSAHLERRSPEHAAPKRPPKPKAKVKRQRPPNLGPIVYEPDVPPPKTPTLIRTVETLRVGVVQIRGLRTAPMPEFAPCSHTPATSSGLSSKKNSASSCPGSSPVSSVLRVHIKIDGKEVFQTSPVPTSDNCVLSGEHVQILPPHFKSLQFVIVETVDGRITRQLGRRSLKRREVLGSPQQELWLSIEPPHQTPIPGQPLFVQQPICEELGQICLDIHFDPTTKELEFRVLNCTVWKRWAPPCCPAHVQNCANPQCPRRAHSPNPTASPLLLQRHQLHPQLLQHRSLPGDALYYASTSTLADQEAGTRTPLLGTPQLSKKAAKLAISPKISRKNRHSHHTAALQPPLTPTLGSLERRRQTSLVSQPLPRPEPPPPAPFGTPGAPLYLSACVMTPQGQTAARKLRIVERRGLEAVRIDCRAIAPHFDGRSPPATAPPYVHPRLGVPLTPTHVEPTSALCLKIASEPDVDASCYGTAVVDLDERTMLPIERNFCGPNWYSLKSRSKQTVATTGPICAPNAVHSADGLGAAGLAAKPQTAAANDENAVGEMRIRLRHFIEEVLPFNTYQPLYNSLLSSVGPSGSSVFGDLEVIARPLMKVFADAKKMGPFRAARVSRVSRERAGREHALPQAKILYEMMVFVGQDYLSYAMKPLIDLIYAERKCCEIDPARLKGVSPEVLEANQRQFLVYAELAFSRVVDTAARCPPLMREVFHELRSVVDHSFAHRGNMGRLAVSSFLIMRFFSAAIMAPKSYGLKKEAPDADVNRTLTLISKTLQRLYNCVVSDAPLTIKEQWLNPMLERLLDEGHRTAMLEFLDFVSTPASTSSEPLSPASEPSRVPSPSPSDDLEAAPQVLKDGHMVERRSGSDKKRSFKNLIRQKRRYVTLTENELSWQKMKENGTDLELKGSYSMADITAVTTLADSKHTFCVQTLNSEVSFQANNPTEMNEWMVLIHKQQLRHMMTQRQPKRSLPSPSNTPDVDVEHELAVIHSVLKSNLELLVEWKNKLEQPGHVRLRADPNLLDKRISEAESEEKQELIKSDLHAAISNSIQHTQQIDFIRTKLR